MQLIAPACIMVATCRVTNTSKDILEGGHPCNITLGQGVDNCAHSQPLHLIGTMLALEFSWFAPRLIRHRPPNWHPLNSSATESITGYQRKPSSKAGRYDYMPGSFRECDTCIYRLSRLKLQGTALGCLRMSLTHRA
eukprot:1161696-Pelagomonas_calceolata.AAC.45